MTFSRTSFSKRGFTLLELLVTLTIGTALLGVTVFSYRSFQDRLSVSGAAQEIAISIRQAQLYAVSAKGTATGSFTDTYGISFNLADPSSYYIFVDTNHNKTYDSGSTCPSDPGNDVCIEKDAILNKVKISQLKFVSSSGLTTVEVSANGSPTASATFTRPNPDATIARSKSGIITTPYQSMQITLKSPGGVTSTVTVSTTGQVGIQ